MCSGLLPFLVSLLRAHPRDEHIVLEAASVLKNFAFANDAARSACAAAEAATAVMCVLSRSPHAFPPFFVLTTHRPRETKPREAALFSPHASYAANSFCLHARARQRCLSFFFFALRVFAAQPGHKVGGCSNGCRELCAREQILCGSDDFCSECDALMEAGCMRAMAQILHRGYTVQCITPDISHHPILQQACGRCIFCLSRQILCGVRRCT